MWIGTYSLTFEGIYLCLLAKVLLTQLTPNWVLSFNKTYSVFYSYVDDYITQLCRQLLLENNFFLVFGFSQQTYVSFVSNEDTDTITVPIIYVQCTYTLIV